MTDPSAPYHAHIYYTEDTRALATALERRLAEARLPELFVIGELRDRPVGPHPIPQFEIHFARAVLPQILALLEAAGLTCLVHPLTDDDLADHTTLAHWIGAPLPLDLEVLDPPGHNQAIARFGKTRL